MRKPKYRLSPNEVERLVKEERERLRKLRIVQVREQAKANAALIRSQVKNEKERLLADFADEVKQEVLAEKDEKIRKLEQRYDSTLRSIGEGHAQVLLHGDGQKIAERLHKRLEDEERAMERYKTAKEKHDREKAQEEWEASRNIRNRNLALETESKRAAHIASLPPPKSDEISFDEKPTQKKAIPMTDMKSFAATHYHIPDYQVVKAGPEEQLYDAKFDAEQADKRLKQDLKEKKVSHHEQVEKARIRGNEALHKEMLKHDLSDMMKDLSLLQRKDRRRRQALLAEVPSQVFVPPERCLQDRADQQLDMERQFEEMYMDKQQKPDSSTLQTWSELPAGDDDTVTNEESEMSTLDSVPLPPSEMALRDFGATRGAPAALSNKSYGQEVPSTSGKNPDTVLKQLLNKIKEQKLNAMASNQKPGTVPTHHHIKSGKDVDAASLTSASESRASWKRSMENVDEESQNDYPVKGHGIGMNGLETDRKSEDSGDTKSSGSKFLHENSALIEELQQRIQKIEDQKLCLAQQLHNQSQFYQELQKQQQELQDLKLIPQGSSLLSGLSTSSQQQLQQKLLSYSHDKNEYDEPTLEDVSLPSRADSQSNIHEMVLQAAKHTNSRGVRILPSSGEERNVRQEDDLANAASRLRPVAGILKGTMNPQFELLTSNGFLPQSLEENDNNVTGDRVGKIEIRELDPTIDTNLLFQLDNINPGVKDGGGARRMIDFGGRDLKKTEAPMGNLSARSDATDSMQPMKGGEAMMTEDPMKQKIQDYHSRAQDLHASMDESTLNKVRDYQQHILQTHQDRKELLENIRDDIERRRQALYSTSKFVGSGGAFLMNLVGTSDSGGDAPSSARGQISLPPKVTSSSSFSLSAASSYPMISAGFGSRQATLSHSQSEKVLEPIKPFIADPWISNRKQQPQQSILKPSSDFPAYSDLSNIGVAAAAPIPSQGVKPPSSIEKIRKSLAFDDLNESNVDASPAIYRIGEGGDSFNDTSASRHSQAFTDDSKLTTSEEDRGSPILQGSRSEHWDTSNSITGSSSLNGSALVAQAEQRREGFERRQQELRSQLMDIQHQKEAILMRYYKGQQAIQDQQTSLRNRMLFPNQTSTQPQTSASGQTHPRTESPQHETWTSKQSKFQSGSGGSDAGSSIGYDRLSGKSSKSSGSGRDSLNLTGDDYLEDISYHQVKGTNQPTMSLQLPQSTSTRDSLGQKSRKDHGGRGGGGAVTFADEQTKFSKFEDYDDSETSLKEPMDSFGTWASVLSSSTNKPSSSNLPSSSLSSTTPAWSLGIRRGQEMTDESSRNLQVVQQRDYDDQDSSSPHDDTDDFESSNLPPSSQTPERSHLHQPHELSTILEVDTPTATNSIAGSSIRLAPPSASQSLQSLYSQGSGLGNGAGGLGGSSLPYGSRSDVSGSIVMDPFPDLPQELPPGGGLGGSSLSATSMAHQLHRRGEGGGEYHLASEGVGDGGGISRREAGEYYDDDDDDVRGEGDGIRGTEVSLGATSSCYTLESEPADVESNLDTSGGFGCNLSQ